MTAVALAASASFFVTVCGGQSAPNVDAAQTLRAGATAIAAVKTVNATLKFSRGSITFQKFVLVSAKATVRLPDESDTVYTVKQQDLSFPVEVVITGGHVYIRPPFSTFVQATPADAAAVPDLAKLFDPSTGLPAVIVGGRNPRFLGGEQVAGVDAYKVSATYSPEQIKAMLSTLSSAGDVQATIWVDTKDHLIHKAILDGDFGDGGKPATVEVDLTGFNSTVVIASPTP